MSATTGYFVAGSSWLHRRNPLTKLLALGLVLLAAFLLPPFVLLVLALVIVVAVCVRRPAPPDGSGAAHPGGAALFDPGRQQPLLPGRHRRPGLGRAAGGHARGPELRARSRPVGSSSRSSLSVPFLFTTLADDLLEALISRGASHRIAFVVLSAVQIVPRMQARAGAILEAQQARGLSMKGSFIGRMRKLVPLVTPVLLGSLVDVRERTFALEARGFGARPGRTAYRVVADPPIDRWLRLLILAGAVAVVLCRARGHPPVTVEADDGARRRRPRS